MAHAEASMGGPARGGGWWREGRGWGDWHRLLVVAVTGEGVLPGSMASGGPVG